MNIHDKKYKELIKHIFENGSDKADRTNIGTKSVFGYNIRFKMDDGFPLLTLRKIHNKSLIHELLWFLKSYDEKYDKFGNTNIKYLIDNGVTFWSDWPYKDYRSKKLEKYMQNDLIDEKTVKKFKMLNQKEFETKIEKDDNFALKWGDLGPVYGKQWVDWNGHYEKVEVKKEYNYTKSETKIVDHLGWKDVYFPGINQIDNLIDGLMSNPDSRRHIVNAWNVNDVDDMMLPPCHILFQCYVKTLSHKERLEYYFDNDKYQIVTFMDKYDRVEQIHKLNDLNVSTKSLSLQLYQRSVDVGLGLPFNIASYSILLNMIASVVNMKPDEFIWQGGDVHIYKNHEEQLTELLTRDSFKPCKLKIEKKVSIYDYRYEDFEFVNYEYHPNIKMEVAV